MGNRGRSAQGVSCSALRSSRPLAGVKRALPLPLWVTSAAVVAVLLRVSSSSSSRAQATSDADILFGRGEAGGECAAEDCGQGFGTRGTPGRCFCDENCLFFEDCCDNYCDACGVQDASCPQPSTTMIFTPSLSCKDSCDGLVASQVGGGGAVQFCWCNTLCHEFEDCCDDLVGECGEAFAEPPAEPGQDREGEGDDSSDSTPTETDSGSAPPPRTDPVRGTGTYDPSLSCANTCDAEASLVVNADEYRYCSCEELCDPALNPALGYASSAFACCDDVLDYCEFASANTTLTCKDSCATGLTADPTNLDYCFCYDGCIGDACCDDYEEVCADFVDEEVQVTFNADLSCSGACNTNVLFATSENTFDYCSCYNQCVEEENCCDDKEEMCPVYDLIDSCPCDEHLATISFTTDNFPVETSFLVSEEKVDRATNASTVSTILAFDQVRDSSAAAIAAARADRRNEESDKPTQSLRTFPTNASAFDVPVTFGALAPDTTYNFTACLNRSTEVETYAYTFEFFDSAYDGVCCSHGEGGWVVDFDGTPVARSAGVFEDVESRTVAADMVTAECRPSVGTGEPTDAPTDSPTDPSTEPSTGAPTEAPTAAPTDTTTETTTETTSPGGGGGGGGECTCRGVDPQGASIRCFNDPSCDLPYVSLGCNVMGMPTCRFCTLPEETGRFDTIYRDIPCPQGIDDDPSNGGGGCQCTGVLDDGTKETCFTDESCTRGDLGCNVNGELSCRFCGFGVYGNIPCRF